MKRFHWGKGAAALAGVVLAACLIAGPAVADRGGDARQFIESLADQAIQSLTGGNVARDERIHRFQALFDANFAVDTIGKWVLGRYWRQTTPAEQAEYLRLFEDYIVASYVDRFAAYAGEKLRITKVLTPAGEPATVFSEIVMPDSGKTPVRVDWRIEGEDHQLKIVDLVVEGVSMSTTMRSDFGSIIRRDGGKIGGLLTVLREKTATLKSAN